VTQKNLVLIIAREFASLLATPTFVSDAEGNLVFYNEAAENVLGRSYSEAGEMPAGRWSELFSVSDLEGVPLPLEQMASGIALLEGRPAHGPVRITSLDGVERELEVTAFPLFAHPDEQVGMIAIFWQRGSG
jgi:PAS domain-containing protein